LPTNLQNFTHKDLTEVKIFQNVLGGYFFETPCMCQTRKKLEQIFEILILKSLTNFLTIWPTATELSRPTGLLQLKTLNENEQYCSFANTKS